MCIALLLRSVFLAKSIFQLQESAVAETLRQIAPPREDHRAEKGTESLQGLLPWKTKWRLFKVAFLHKHPTNHPAGTQGKAKKQTGNREGGTTKESHLNQVRGIQIN
jgi:hypothetical protein